MPLNDGSLEENIKRLLPQVKNLVRENSMAFRKQNAVGQKWAVATISDKIQEQLKAQTKEVWLSDDTLIKMMIHHPELNLMPLFTNVQVILDNAIKIVKKDDLNVMYLSKREKNYVAMLKAVKGRDELYLTTIYQVDDKRFKKELEKLEGDH